MDSSEIEVLKGLEAVRRRPEMYIGPLSAADLPSRLLVQALATRSTSLDGNCKRHMVSGA